LLIIPRGFNIMKYSQAALASLLAGMVAGCSALPTGYSSRSKSNLEELFTNNESMVATNQTRATNIPDNGLRIKKSERGNMKSYVVRGQRYHTMPQSDGYSARGLASWYAAALQLGMVNDGTAMVNIEALTAQEVAELSGPENKWGVEFYTDESVVAAAKTEATETVATTAVPASETVAASVGTEAAEQLPAVGSAVRIDPEDLFIADEKIDADGGELLSLDSLESELAAADAASIDNGVLTAEANNPVGAEEIKVQVNAEATTEVRKAAGLPVDLIENASAAGQPVSLTSIGAVQTTKAVEDTSQAQNLTLAQADQGGEVVALPTSLKADDVTSVASSKVNGPGYYIQAGVFANVKDAEKVAVEAVLAVPLEEVHVKPLKGSDMYRITVGPITAADHAAEVSGKLEDAGVDNFTVKVKSIQ